MRQWKYCVVIALMISLASSGIILFYKKQSSSGIRNFNFDKDAAAVDALFHKDDNLYWLLNDYSLKHGFSMDHMLRYRSSSQHEKLYNLVLRILEVDGKIAGFVGYHPNSMYIWQLLWLAVDQDYRRQGIAKKLLNYAVEDMVRRGAIKIELATRPVNVRAKALYNQFGFKQVDEDQDFAYFSWHKSKSR